MKKVLKVPFDSFGNMMFYDANGYDLSGITQRDNHPFNATLELIKITKGRSRVTYTLRDTTSGVTYPMNQTNFIAMAIGTKFNGLFDAVKRGANYSLRSLNNVPARPIEQPKFAPVPEDAVTPI